MGAVIAMAGSDDLQAIRRVQAANERAWLELPAVGGVGIDDALIPPTIVIQLNHENLTTRSKIPSCVEGIPVRVVVSGHYVAAHGALWRTVAGILRRLRRRLASH